MPIELKLISPSHSGVITLPSSTPKSLTRQSTSRRPYFQAMRKNRAPICMAGSLIHKPEPCSHSCCLPWHAAAAHTLDQILKTHQEGLHKLPMGRKPLMESSLLIRLKRQTTPISTTLPFPLCVKRHEGTQVFLPLSRNSGIPQI